MPLLRIKFRDAGRNALTDLQETVSMEPLMELAPEIKGVVNYLRPLECRLFRDIKERIF